MGVSAGVSLLGLLVVPPAAAQTTTSGAEDAAVMREAKAAADTSGCATGAHCLEVLNSWTAATGPCGDGYQYTSRSWLGVACDARGGRVVWVQLASINVGGKLLPFFGRLGALLALGLSGNPALRGDVADLAGATELRDLSLLNCPLVVGEAAALAALVHLGEEYTQPGQSWTSTGGLRLAGSGVHGPVAALRALPGLGARPRRRLGHLLQVLGLPRLRRGGVGAGGREPQRPRSPFCLSLILIELTEGLGAGPG